MASKYCPFWVDKGGFWAYNYECKNSGQSFTDSEAIYKTYCSQEDNHKKCPHFKPQEEDKNCYLTCACVDAMGFADDCEDLTILRGFRDNWLAKQPEGPDEIQHYYSIAPKIVAAIHAMENRNEILHKLYETLVCSCVKAIKENHPETAHRIYRQNSLDLEKEYLK